MSGLKNTRVFLGYVDGLSETGIRHGHSAFCPSTLAHIATKHSKKQFEHDCKPAN